MSDWWIDALAAMTNRTAYDRCAPDAAGNLVYEFAWRRADGGWEFGKGATEENAAKALLTRIAEHHEARAKAHAHDAGRARGYLSAAPPPREEEG